jgi:hypothetical protein
MEISRYASRLTAPGTFADVDAPVASNATETLSESREANTAQAKAESGLSPSLGIPRNLPQEPEDARLTGGTRSLSRRLLALNIPTSRASAERLPKRGFNRETPSASGHKPKMPKRPALSANWIGQDA